MTQEQVDMIDELIDLDHGLRPAEMDFIEQISHYDEDDELSEKQADWLEDIYQRLCS